MTQQLVATHSEEDIFIFTLQNGSTKVSISNFGATVLSVLTPDKEGNVSDIVLGFDTVDEYIQHNPAYFGSVIGRYANRIAKGEFELEGKKYRLAQNNGENHLHGGIEGFDKKVWEPAFSEDTNTLHLEYTSRDGEEGYPGNLHVVVVYTLTQDNELKIDYQAITDKPTILNLTNHTYFNLGRHETILDHTVRIASDSFVETREDGIPIGSTRTVTGTPFDLREPRRLREQMKDDFEQLQFGPGGFDHTFVLDTSSELKKVAEVSEEESGRILEVFTTEPGVQLYTGNFLDATIRGKGGRVYKKHAGLCLETQHYPDSPHHEAFPKVILRPGETFSSQTIYKFSV